MNPYGCWIGLVLVACNQAPGGAQADHVTPFSDKAVTVTGVASAARASTVAATTLPASAPSVSERAKTDVTKDVSLSSLRVKRLVVTTGVKDREPLVGAVALPSDGSPIYAFAELANPDGESENVRITFERKGGAERVGNVTLPVPAKVGRHRTWAITHFIRAAGVWEAVVWSETGRELGRTSFEVAAS